MLQIVVMNKLALQMALIGDIDATNGNSVGDGDSTADEGVDGGCQPKKAIVTSAEADAATGPDGRWRPGILGRADDCMEVFSDSRVSKVQQGNLFSAIKIANSWL